MKVYDFKVKNAEQNEVSIESYKGKVLLIVNTATGCGLTPQYKGLQHLYEKYQTEGFEILDFPCNQFLGQAPGTNEEIVSFCHLKFGVTFKTFSKINVNGAHAEPLYTYLKSEAPKDLEDTEASGFKKVLKDLGQIVTGSDIKWNFTKFLVDREGNVVARYSPTFKPESLEASIIEVLNKS